MKYLVSGARRTGTSMMMHALSFGSTGLDMLAAPSMEDNNPEFEGYKPNPNGLFEVGIVRYLEPRFLRKIPDNCLVKILFDGLPNLPQIPGVDNLYKIIFMSRDVDEIKRSCDRVEQFRQDLNIAADSFEDSPLEITRILPFSCFRPYNQEDIDHVLGICSVRRDIDLTFIDYAEVIDDPLSVFTRLKSLGWPIDPEKCASVIDPKLYRTRS
jgi:hypothetical protein